MLPDQSCFSWSDYFLFFLWETGNLCYLCFHDSQGEFQGANLTPEAVDGSCQVVITNQTKVTFLEQDGHQGRLGQVTTLSKLLKEVGKVSKVAGRPVNNGTFSRAKHELFFKPKAHNEMWKSYLSYLNSKNLGISWVLRFVEADEQEELQVVGAQIFTTKKFKLQDKSMVIPAVSAEEHADSDDDKDDKENFPDGEDRWVSDKSS